MARAEYNIRIYFNLESSVATVVRNPYVLRYINVRELLGGARHGECQLTALLPQRPEAGRSGAGRIQAGPSPTATILAFAYFTSAANLCTSRSSTRRPSEVML